jgi:DNA-binding GntR family transcriptional regulator
MTIDGLAARAGIGRTTVKNVLRKAREDGLITLERHWRASSVRIISPAWLEWLEWLEWQ